MPRAWSRGRAAASAAAQACGLRQPFGAAVAEPSARAFAQAVELGARTARRARGPLLPHPHHVGAGGGERRVERAGQVGPSLPERAVPLRERGAIARQGSQVLPVRERQEPVEIGPPLGRGPGGEPHVVREERHREPPAHGIGHPHGLLALDQDSLPPALRRVRGPDVGDGSALDPGLDLKPGTLESRHLLVRRAAEGAEEHRVVDGLEQVGLALGVGAEEDKAGRGKLAVEVREVPEPSSHQVAEPHYSMRIWRLTGLPCSPSRSTPWTRTITVAPLRPRVESCSAKSTVSCPSPLDRREALVGAADLEVHRVDPVGVVGASPHDQQVALDDHGIGRRGLIDLGSRAGAVTRVLDRKGQPVPLAAAHQRREQPPTEMPVLESWKNSRLQGEIAGSGPGEDGLSLLQKRPGSLAHVGRRAEQAEPGGLEPQRLVQAHLEAGVHQLEAGPDGERPVLQDRPEQRVESGSSRSAGTTRLTSPIRHASWASIMPPVSSSSSARPRPTSRGSRTVPP